MGFAERKRERESWKTGKKEVAFGLLLTCTIDQTQQ
jgi:hypothetical protein